MSKTREVFKQLENSNFVQSSSKPGSITSQLVSEDSKISEDISHSVYETFGVRLRPKAKDSTVENKSQTPEKEISSKDGNSTQEAEQDSASKLEEQESSEQQTRRVSEAIASKLALFDSPEQPQTIIPPKISSQSRKGMVCVVCRRVVHPVERV